MFVGISVCYAGLQPISAVDQNVFSHVQIQLSRADALTGHFKQVRKMRLLSKPLISEGNFVLSKKNGLRWYQVSPFKSTLIVTSDKIEQKIGNAPAMVITKKEQPIVFSFTKIFLSLFNGNTKSVEGYFSIYFRGNTKAWEIVLKPIGSPLNKAIASIEMSGGLNINSITINEAKNNQMILYFSHVKELTL